MQSENRRRRVVQREEQNCPRTIVDVINNSARETRRKGSENIRKTSKTAVNAELATGLDCTFAEVCRCIL